MSKSKKQTRYGLFYRSHNRWVGPYYGVTVTKYTMNRNPYKTEARNLANNVLKTRIKMMPVES